MVGIRITGDAMDVAGLISLAFRRHRPYYVVSEADTGGETLRRMTSEWYDLAILDLLLPDPDGFVDLRRLRETSGAPVIVSMATTLEPDELRGREPRADEDATKQNSHKELIARAGAVLGRTVADSQQPPRSDMMRYRALEVDDAHHRVTVRGRPARLPPPSTGCSSNTRATIAGY